MSPTIIHLYRYDLPLLRPLPGSDGAFVRKGLLVESICPDGRSVYAEASPLPGFSPESLEEATSEMMRWLPSVLESPGVMDLEWLRRQSEKVRYPSVRFALEVLFLKQWALKQDRNWPHLFEPHFKRQIPINGLLEGEQKDWARSLDRLLERGVKTIKVKLGKQTLFRSLELLSELSENHPKDVKWRFDANGAWSLEEAIEICKAMEGLNVDYLEEPLRDVSEWNRLAEQTSIPLALDEHLASLSPLELSRFKNLDTIVLKPTIRGGVLVCRDWAQAAKDMGIRTSFTSAFETWCGLQAVAELQVVCGIDTPAGLGTLEWFEPHDVLAPPARLRTGEIKVSEWLKKVNFKNENYITLLKSWPKSPAL